MRDEFMIERQGKKFVLFAGLLDAFHGMAEDFDESGAKPVIETELVQIPVVDGDPTGEGMAIVSASVGYKLDEKWVYGPFQGIGDASKENVGRNIAPHLIRMAETRAKARALRDAINVGVTAFEELGGEDGEGSGAYQERRPTPDETPGVERGAAKNAKGSPNKVRKSQVDMLKTLAVEWRGEGGVERLENRIGKPLTELTREEANEWIDKLTPEGRE